MLRFLTTRSEAACATFFRPFISAEARSFWKETVTYQTSDFEARPS